MTSIKSITYHAKCGLPVELCVCGGDYDPTITTACRCLSCCEGFFAVAPPGLPVSDYQCPTCLEIGFVVKIESEDLENEQF